MILRHVTVDCADPYEVGMFWSSVTGWPLADDDHPGDPEVLVQAPSPGVPGLLFIRVPEPKTVKNRVHIDWVPTERTAGRRGRAHRWRWARPCTRTTACPMAAAG